MFRLLYLSMLTFAVKEHGVEYSHPCVISITHLCDFIIYIFTVKHLHVSVKARVSMNYNRSNAILH